MREIKFRAWHEESREMYEVLTLDFKNNHVYMVSLKHSNHYRGANLDEVILMQYTVLKDKNGKEIYEGDIIAYEDSLNNITQYYSVEFDDNIDCDGMEYQCSGWFMPYGINPKIIGNVYETPELLNVKQ